MGEFLEAGEEQNPDFDPLTRFRLFLLPPRVRDSSLRPSTARIITNRGFFCNFCDVGVIIRVHQDLVVKSSTLKESAGQLAAAPLLFEQCDTSNIAILH